MYAFMLLSTNTGEIDIIFITKIKKKRFLSNSTPAFRLIIQSNTRGMKHSATLVSISKKGGSAKSGGHFPFCFQQLFQKAALPYLDQYSWTCCYICKRWLVAASMEYNAEGKRSRSFIRICGQKGPASAMYIQF